MAQERKVPVLRSENSLIEQEFESIREKFDVEMHKMEEEMSKFRSQLIASKKDRRVTSHSSSMSTSTSSTSESRSSDKKQQLSSSSGSNEQQSASFGASQQQMFDGQSLSSSSSARRLASSVKSSIKSALEEQQELIQRHKQKLELNQTSANNDIQTTRSSGSTSYNNWLQEISSPLIKDANDGNGKILKLRFDVTQYEPDQIVVKTIDNRLQVHAKREEISQNTTMYREYNREFLLPDGIDPESIRSSLSADGVLTVEAPLPIEK